MLGDRDAINLDTFKMYLKGMMEDMREERGFYGTMRESFRQYGSCRSINGLENLMEEDMIKLKKDFWLSKECAFHCGFKVNNSIMDYFMRSAS